MRPLPAGELLRSTSLAHRPFVGPTGARPRTIKAASLASHQDAYDEMGMRESRRRVRRSYGALSFFDIKARRDADGNRLLTQEEWAAGLYRGQTVIGRVIESNVNGSVIEILKRLRPPETPSAFDYGWMPSQERPVNLRDADHPSKFSKEINPMFLPPVPIGTVRHFEVKKLPRATRHPVFRHHRVTPLVSAYYIDRDLLWQRGFQLVQLCERWRENFPMRVEAVTDAAMSGRVAGIPTTIPREELPVDDVHLDVESLEKKYLGQKIQVSLVDADVRHQQLIGSLEHARINDFVRNIQIGDLVTCVVRRSTSRGCVLGIQGTNETGLLHISCMSKAFVRDPTVRQGLLVWDFGLGSFNCHFIINATDPTLYQVVFESGEVIHAIVVGYDPGPSNLAFSTAELEEEAGDILHNRQKCWDSKQRMREHFMEQAETEVAEQVPMPQESKEPGSLWAADME